MICLQLCLKHMCMRWRYYLEHGSDMLQMCGTGEGSLHVADSLHQSFGRLSHLLHLQVVQQAPLLLAGHT